MDFDSISYKAVPVRTLAIADDCTLDGGLVRTTQTASVTGSAIVNGQTIATSWGAKRMGKAIAGKDGMGLAFLNGIALNVTNPPAAPARNRNKGNKVAS